ncbi:hypothetical protein CHY08_10730 [Rhizobium leguminosarum bv. viciae]|nr:hypothetical protein CHY08_10730 [Rhizobium leguminosarum bv. viciae]
MHVEFSSSRKLRRPDEVPAELEMGCDFMEHWPPKSRISGWMKTNAATDGRPRRSRMCTVLLRQPMLAV